MAAGVGAIGIDYTGTVDRLAAKLAAGETDDTTLWLARWLTGNVILNEAEALTEVQAVDAMNAESQRARVRDMLYTAIRMTGRDSLQPDSTYAADYARGYAALELAFPGISEQNPEGGFKSYQGGINLFASRIKTERGGNIEFMIPGGGLVVGLSNTPEALTKPPASGDDAGVLGIVTADVGDIKGVARDDILVNQSRILTVGAAMCCCGRARATSTRARARRLLPQCRPPSCASIPTAMSRWSSRARRRAAVLVRCRRGRAAGDVDLIAPKGTVNAGDAGIRAGNLNIAAPVGVLGAGEHFGVRQFDRHAGGRHQRGYSGVQRRHHRRAAMWRRARPRCRSNLADAARGGTEAGVQADLHHRRGGRARGIRGINGPRQGVGREHFSAAAWRRHGAPLEGEAVVASRSIGNNHALPASAFSAGWGMARTDHTGFSTLSSPVWIIRRLVKPG